MALLSPPDGLRIPSFLGDLERFRFPIPPPPIELDSNGDAEELMMGTRLALLGNSFLVVDDEEIGNLFSVWSCRLFELSKPIIDCRLYRFKDCLLSGFGFLMGPTNDSRRRSLEKVMVEFNS